MKYIINFLLVFFFGLNLSAIDFTKRIEWSEFQYNSPDLVGYHWQDGTIYYQVGFYVPTGRYFLYCVPSKGEQYNTYNTAFIDLSIFSGMSVGDISYILSTNNLQPPQGISILKLQSESQSSTFDALLLIID